MPARSQYSGSAAARSALLCLATLEFLLVENLIIGLSLGGESMFATLSFILQLPHLVTIVACVVIVWYNRRARALITMLLVAYVVAIVCDVLGVVAHAIFAYKATDAQDTRRHVLFCFVLFLLVLLDALGAHFADRLRDCYAEETANIESFKTATV